MKTAMGLAATVLVGLVASAGPARSDCKTVVQDMKDAIQVAAKNYGQSIEEIKAATDKAKARSHFCAITGEFQGTATAYRAVVNECSSGSERREELASLDKSIGDLQAAIDSTCK
jgi:hypothetical protein